MRWEEKLASRTARMEASAVREILKVATSPGVISLAGGLPTAESFPLEIMEELMGAVLGRYGARALQYDASEGFFPLREALVPLLAGRGIETSAEEILVVSGSQSALDGMGKILISPGDAIDERGERIHIGALELGKLAVFEYLADDFVFRCEIVQHVGGGGND